VEEDWQRPRFVPGGGDASVLYAVFGPKPEPLRVTSLAHRVLPMELSLELEYMEPDVAASLLDESLMAGFTGEESPAALTADGCMVMRADVSDPPDLRYLRNCIGVVTAILEAGGKAAANLQSLSMLTPDQWRGVIFGPDEPQPRLHVNVFHAKDDDGAMTVTTRGMRAFGRPDLLVRGVPEADLPAASELCNQLIEAQAFGAVVADGDRVAIPGREVELTARREGSLEEPAFNNVHLDLAWP